MNDNLTFEIEIVQNRDFNTYKTNYRVEYLTQYAYFEIDIKKYFNQSSLEIWPYNN